jgi:hypothetical protein
VALLASCQELDIPLICRMPSAKTRSKAPVHGAIKPSIIIRIQASGYEEPPDRTAIKRWVVIRFPR